ncbi:hypothetical protein QTI33_11840 [Variovorax sp. J22P271]|uniref:hypothetical protein n=1 Tax=Variovorax davisae TaxID=3053515 RepID=UPI0025787618|nr:hypothetical protein [Variovorax sp. J22P271]MDM0032815.1 hypothetical protein [Variovorax sp. J22P271]
MNHACPSCRGAGIPALAKRWSARECPATCALCGGLSHVLASTSNGIFVGTLLVFIVALIAAIALTGAPWLAAVLAVCPTLAFNWWAWRRADMFPIPKENAQAAAAVGWFLAGLYALFALFG